MTGRLDLSALIAPQVHGKPFTACPPCPGCGTVAVHWLRLPVERTAEMAALLARFPGLAWGSSHPVELAPWDEAEHEVVRECRACGSTWGEGRVL